jgi:hypothetical protein
MMTAKVTDGLFVGINEIKELLRSSAEPSEVFVRFCDWWQSCEEVKRAEKPLGEFSFAMDLIVSRPLSAWLKRPVRPQRSCWVNVEAHGLTHGTFKLGFREGVALFFDDLGLGLVSLGPMLGYNAKLLKFSLVPGATCPGATCPGLMCGHGAN